MPTPDQGPGLTLSAKDGGRRGFSGRLLREPLLHFLVIGTLLTGAVHLLQTPTSRAREIAVTPALVERLSTLYRLQTGALPDEDRREWLVKSYIREEMLFREAKSLRLDEGDELVRRRLVQKIEFLQSDTAIPSDPGDAVLRAFHQSNPQRFVAPASVDFSHIFFSPDKRGPAGAREAATRALAALGQGADPSTLGDRFPLQPAFTNVTQADLSRVFGPKPIASVPFAREPGLWSGPVESGYGWHLIRVTALTPARPMAYDEAEELVRTAWKAEQLDRFEATRMEELARLYTVVRTDRPPPSTGSAGATAVPISPP